MRALLVVLLLCCVALLATAGSARAVAVSIQADNAHTGDAGDVGLHLPLRRAWSLSLPGGVTYPVAADGRAFVVHRRPRYQDGSEVVAVSIQSGRVLWRRDLGAEASSAALGYGGGRLVVARESYYDPGDPSAVLALDPSDGRVVWEYGTLLFDALPPVVEGGSIYVKGVPQDGVTALRLADGAFLWRTLTDSGDAGALAVAGDSVWASQSSCPDVHRFRASDGVELWHHENGCHGGGGSTVSLYGGRLYVLESDHYPPGDVYDAVGGALLGTVRADISPAFSGDLAVFPNTRRPLSDTDQYGHKLVARNLSTGRVRWRFRGDGYLDSAPLIASGVLFVGSGSGRVYGVSLRSGRAVWRGSAGAPVPAPSISGNTGLAAAEGTLLVPAKGRLVAYH
jgi:outer membrane protein assembly factor BamB